jgi:hypothetical protein
VRLPKALRAARAHTSYATSRSSPFDFLTAGNRGNDIPDGMRNGRRLQGDQSAAIDVIGRAAANSDTRRR